MSTIEPEQQSPQASHNAETRVQYREDLAGPDDAWITITDAARITRTSEAMARRWVASGRLPIKRQPGGINQQTRLVRLSDVATIRPIIDPTAAISEEIHKLDLPSIPRQQAHIMHEHERLVQQIQQGQHAVIEVRRDLHEAVTQQQQAVEELHQQVVSSQRSLTLQQQHCDLLTEQVRDLAHAFEQTYNDLQEQGKRLQQEVELLRTTVMNQLQTAQQEVERKLSELDVDHRAHREQLRENLTTLVQQHHERVQDVLSVMGETLTRLDQSHDQLRQDVLTQQQAIVQLKEDLTALIGRQGREIKIALEQHVSQQAQERAELSNRLETIEQWREQLVAQAYQQRIDAQDQQIQALTRMLQDEREGRELLDEQLMVQKEQIQLLHREIEGLKQH